jgi:hypothetical protein
MFRMVSGSILVAAMALGGCASANILEGPAPSMERLSSDPIQRANLQTRYIEGLRLSADLPQQARPPVPAEEWRLIQRAGIDQIDEECNNYLSALYRFNAQQKAGRQGLLAATATVGAIMGLAGATTVAIGITAAALGLSASLFEAGTNSLLFSIEASAVRNVVQEARSRYVVTMIANPPTTRPDTMISLRGYLSLCTPAVIEVNINNSANGSRNSVTSSNEAAGIDAAAMAAPALTFATRERQARAQVAGRVDLEPAPPPVRGPEDVRLSGESPTALTPSAVRRVQAALDIPNKTGVLGGEGSATRGAIMEFEAGMNARGERGWNAPTGKLATGSNTTDTLLMLSPMPAGVLSPFERAFLTNTKSVGGAEPFTVLDRDQAVRVWLMLGLQGAMPAPDAGVWQALHDAIKDKRKADSGGKDTSAYLDSSLWNKLPKLN